MDTALSFLERNRERLALKGFGPSDGLTATVLVPRFHTSAHAVFLIRRTGSSEPVLVVKVPRLEGEAPALRREADSLREIHRARPGGFESVPRLVALEEEAGVWYLVETGVPGRPLDSAFARSRPEIGAALLTEWVTEVGVATRRPAPAGETLRSRCGPALELLRRNLTGSASAIALVEETAELIGLHGSAEVPLVFEHGDVSAPNLLLTPAGTLAVVDWELADAGGLPAQDLFFGLGFVAMARDRATDVPAQVGALHRAFLAPHGWARPHVARYFEELALDPQLYTPLFVLCWCRYVAGLAARLGADHEPGGLAPHHVQWLVRNRYFAVWRHALRHADELVLSTKARGGG